MRDLQACQYISSFSLSVCLSILQTFHAHYGEVLHGRFCLIKYKQNLKKKHYFMHNKITKTFTKLQKNKLVLLKKKKKKKKI